MKMEEAHIKHYKSLKDVHFRCGNLIAVIGENNSGKSNIIEAVDLFFNPSKEKISEESYYEKDTSHPIEITVKFKELNTWEKGYLSRWISADKLKIKRVFKWGDPPEINHIWIRDVPAPEWLREDDASLANIEEWWKNKNQLSVGSHQFHDEQAL